jgi:zeaxanthin glucosyltransferase
MRIGFVSHIVTGHANPISSLARTLQARGNEVLFFSMPDGAPFATAAGLKHVSFAEQEFPLGSALQAQAIQSRLQGHEATMFALNRLGDTCDALFRHLPAVLAGAELDGVVLDPAHIGAGLIPASLGLPYIHVNLSFHFDLTGQTPFFIFDWPYETTREAIARNKIGAAAVSKLIEPLYAKARDFAASQNLTVDFSDPFATLSPLAILTQVPREFDFPGVFGRGTFIHRSIQ